MPDKLKIFISYAHEDEDIKTQLDKGLISLKKSNKVEVWQDREIIAGKEWDQAIKAELEAADIILLLISVDFNNSQYIWDKELAVALQKHEKDTARVIPIIARECDWSEMPYAKLQALPKDAIPISKFADRDEAYTQIAKAIGRVVDFLLEEK